MKNVLLLVGVLLGVIAMWYFSLVIPAKELEAPVLVEQLQEVNNWFSIVALAFALFALCMLILSMESQRKQFRTSLQQNQLSMEIMALSSLIQEADATLHRYDRWEAAGIKGDYVNAKSGVREKMNQQREMLERKYEALANYNA